MTETNPFQSPDAELQIEAEELQTVVIMYPLAPAQLWKLFLQPGEFFARHVRIEAPLSTLLVTYLLGMVNVMDRVDQKLIQKDLGKAAGMSLQLLGSWGSYWMLVMLGGILSAIVSWYVGGWWFKMRVKWSGATVVDPRQARLIYVYAYFILNLPILLVALYQTLRFSDYSQAWEASEMTTSIITLLMLVWSCVVGYLGVKAKFDVIPWRAFLWFVVLPVTLVGAAMAFLIYAYFMLEG